MATISCDVLHAAPSAPRPTIQLQALQTSPPHAPAHQPRRGAQRVDPGLLPRQPLQDRLNLAFDVLDRDFDGRLSREEVTLLLSMVSDVAVSRRLATLPAPPQLSLPPPPPLPWDAAVAADLKAATAEPGGVPAAVCRFVASKLSGCRAGVPPASDVVYSAAGAFVAMLALGALAAHAAQLPVVGHFHQQVRSSRPRDRVREVMRRDAMRCDGDRPAIFPTGSPAIFKASLDDGARRGCRCCWAASAR